MLRRFHDLAYIPLQARRLVQLTILTGVLLGGGVLVQAAWATETPTEEASPLGYSLTPSATEPYAVCPPTPGHRECMSIIVPPAAARSTSSLRALPGQAITPAGSIFAAGPGLEGSGEGGGLAPSDLRSAYRLPAMGGSGQTVAIVDAYNDPNAESDLKVYREHYKLEECTESNGCFKKVDQTGETEKEAKSFPANEPGWSEEISLDLDMVSAVCPECHILLVEATNEEKNSSEVYNLDIAEDEAATLKATEISNSWGESETSEETSEDKYFTHENASHEHIPITVAAGDSGYIVSYPAASKDVISVGGTRLYKAPFYERGWFEEAWHDTGSGCSAYELKGSWQTEGCGEKGEKRVDNDIAAVAGTESPVSTYDSYEAPGWRLVGGTSVAAPIVAGVEALSSSVIRAEGAAAFYKHTDPLFDVTTGVDKWKAPTCSPEYLCTAATGYDGPTGNGTPDLDGGGEGSPVKWSSVSIPGPAGHSNSVSCPSSSSCIAVGTNGEEAAAETWNGKEWSSAGVVARPSGAKEESTLSGVSCISAGACTAVGYYVNSSGTKVTLAERWNGTEWSVQSTPNPTGALRSYLEGVSCTSSTACTTVGYYQGSSGEDTMLVERWNGTEWSIQSTPAPAGATSSSLRGVSCSSSSACTAVGIYGTGSSAGTALAESWNGTEWSVQSTPALSGTGLTGVSCTSSSSCEAVGFSSSSTTGAVLERWNGAEWALQTVAQPSKKSYGINLDAVSCTSSSYCEVVGIYYTVGGFSTANAVLAESWNGKEWSVQEPPASGSYENGLEGVSCAGAGVCMATGHLRTSQGYPYNLETNLAYGLSSTSWSLDPMPSTSAGTAVSCTSSTACAAVGGVTGEGEVASDIWNGAMWSSLPAARPSGATRLILSGISCTSRLECTAVGSYTGSSGARVPVAERLTPESAPGTLGKSYWSIQSTPNPTGATASSLSGVLCTSATACIAVGHYTNSSGVEVTLAESWNGTEWSIQSTPNPTGATASSLNGVSCRSSDWCTAVGRSTNSSGTEVTLAENWNGTTWSNEGTPTPTGAKASSLAGVSCWSTSFTGCMAVGRYTNSSGTELMLVEHLKIITWAIQSAPSPTGATSSSLNGVSCSTETACTAAGSYTNSSKRETLEEFWNGVEWSIQPTTNPSEAAESRLNAVSCTSSLCVTTGSTTSKSSLLTNLSEVWASGWSVQTTPNPSGATKSHLAGPNAGGTPVSCTSPAACIAVGYYKNSSGTVVTLAERWNGTEWSIQSTPNPAGATESYFDGISCSSSTACIAVGYDKNSSGTEVTLAERWNGTEWTIQSTPNPTGATMSTLQGISCLLSECTATGSYKNSSGTVVGLAERWNGTEWSIQSTPNPTGATGTYLDGVQCYSVKACITTGYYMNSSGTFVTLAER